MSTGAPTRRACRSRAGGYVERVTYASAFIVVVALCIAAALAPIGCCCIIPIPIDGAGER